MRKLIKIALSILILFLSCKNGNQFYGVDKVEVFGDSLRIETEIHGDSIIKHYIDLKGISDDGFDNSFNVTIVIREEITIPPINCLDKYTFEYNQFLVSLCKEELKSIDIDRPYLRKGIDSLYLDRNIKIHPQSTYNEFILSYIGTLNYQIIQIETNDTIPKLLKGDFRTEFNGGTVYRVINSENDTIDFMQKIEIWM